MIRAGLFAAASALCALGAILTFAAGLMLFCLRSGTADTCFLCTFVLGPSARFFEWMKLRSLYPAEKRSSLADSFDRDPARTVAQRQLEALLERRRAEMLPLSRQASRTESLGLSKGVSLSRAAPSITQQLAEME